MVAKLKQGAAEIAKIQTLQDVLGRINLPNNVASIAKLIRWAYENTKEVPIPTYVNKFSFGEILRALRKKQAKDNCRENFFVAGLKPLRKE